MKKSFFIAFAIYLIAGALLWQIEWPRHEKKEVSRISLASLTIKKPKSACQKCTCKSHTHTPKKEVKPFKEPPKPNPKVSKPKKQKVTKPKPKKIKKKRVKKVVKRVRKKRVEKETKVAKKEPQKVVPHPQKPTALPPSSQSQPSAFSKTLASKPSPKPLPEPSPKFSPELSPKPSYQEHYIKTYASRIRQAIQRHKFYPRIARKTKKQGVVELYFELTPKKELKSLKVTRSSGHAILDRAALKCVKEARSEFPAPTECVKVRVPIVYRLR